MGDCEVRSYYLGRASNHAVLFSIHRPSSLLFLTEKKGTAPLNENTYTKYESNEEELDMTNETVPQSELPKMSKPANRELHNAGFYRLEQFTDVTEADILKIHGVGPKAVRILNEALNEKGLSFASSSKGGDGAAGKKKSREVINKMDAQTVMEELEALGKERMKKMYISNGAKEPLFGCATGAMKPIAKKIKIDQELAEELYATGNYDAMYFAGVIADPKAMTEADFDRWMVGAYFYMLSDYVVAVTLAEADIAQEVADKWIASGEELRMSGGWSCYCWLLGNRKDEEFSTEKLAGMLEKVKETIHDAPERTKSAMNNFVTTVGVSYVPLHEKAVQIANEIGPVEMIREKKKNSILKASENIQKEVERGKIGFKRRYVRC
jgi:3-methyladenine DNA glycosylase AlkD